MMCPARGSAPSCRYDPGPPDFSRVPFPTQRRLAAFSPRSGMNLVQKAGAGGVVVNSRDIAERQPPRQPWTSTQRDWKRFASSPPRSRGSWSSPLRRCSRQVRRFEEYNPSRRSRAPSSPGCVHTFAARRIFSLYSAENRRRVAFASTSTLLAIVPGIARPCEELIAHSLLALYSKLLGGGCLIHIGTEGCVLSGGFEGREGDVRRPRPCGTPVSRVLGSRTSGGLGTGHTSAPGAGSGGRTPGAGETPR